MQKKWWFIIDVSVIKFGTLTIECGESVSEGAYKLGKYFGRLGDSSVIHINFKGKHFLVDTGFANEADRSPENFAYNQKDLELRFQLHGLRLEDIVGIFITHWHPDHFANLHLFPNAEIYCYEPKGRLDFDLFAEWYHFGDLLPATFLRENDEFAGCQLFPTPGHTKSHCSLLVNVMNSNTVIAGDAIVSQSYFDRDEAWPYNAGNLGRAACKQAMDKIIEVADYIIPGHGHPFQNYKKSGI